MNEPPASETEARDLAVLTQRMVRGEDAAFLEFHRAYFARLHRYAFALAGGDAARAADIAQECCVRVARHVRVFEDEAVFWNWLRRVARTAAADLGRKRSRYERALERFALWWDGPDDVDADDARLNAVLERALAAAGEEHREILKQKYELRMSVREIAARLELSEEAVESRLSRARRAVRETVNRLLRHEEEN